MPEEALTMTEARSLLGEFQRLASATERILDQHAEEIKHRADRDVKLAQIEGKLDVFRAESKGQTEQLSKEITQAKSEVTLVSNRVTNYEALQRGFGERMFSLEQWREGYDKAADKRDRFRSAVQLSIIGASVTLALAGIVSAFVIMVRLQPLAERKYPPDEHTTTAIPTPNQR